jgi:hypothetical protein
MDAQRPYVSNRFHERSKTVMENGQELWTAKDYQRSETFGKSHSSSRFIKERTTVVNLSYM